MCFFPPDGWEELPLNCLYLITNLSRFHTSEVRNLENSLRSQNISKSLRSKRNTELAADLLRSPRICHGLPTPTLSLFLKFHSRVPPQTDLPYSWQIYLTWLTQLHVTLITSTRTIWQFTDITSIFFPFPQKNRISFPIKPSQKKDALHTTLDRRSQEQSPCINHKHLKLSTCFAANVYSPPYKTIDMCHIEKWTVFALRMWWNRYKYNIWANFKLFKC